jgi:hypothetical protein
MFTLVNAHKAARFGSTMILAGVLTVAAVRAAAAQDVVPLPTGVRAVWNMDQAYREQTATREKVCINGLWRWQPALTDAANVPAGGWGFFKVPGCWPGVTDYMQKDFQTVHQHPQWREENLARINAAWYQREIETPATWAGRRIVLQADYVNSYAVVFLDGNRVGEIRFPAGELDLTPACRPGQKHVLSMLVVAMPLRSVMLSFNDTNSAREVRGNVARRGLCGDVYLTSEPVGPRITRVTVTTSVRNEELTCDVALDGLAPDARCRLHAAIVENGQTVREFTGTEFSSNELPNGLCTLSTQWKPGKLWDIHTPSHQYDLKLSLQDAAGKALDAFYPVRFGFREFWIEGRDFMLNGTRLFLSAVPLDNAQVGVVPASYAGARESLLRLKSFGINFVYTHNYGCEPGDHLSFAEILRAADDVGMLVALSQPHFSAYDWKAPDADEKNGYARHAEFYARVAQNHPAVVAYSTSHNATGYSEDMNPDLIDGLARPRESWSDNNAKLALRAEAIIKRLDASRIVYHHSSGNLSSMHTINFYPNWTPIQELDDWFEHWSTVGVKPVFPVEYGAPFGWDWAMYRGWYRGNRSFGSGVVPWDLSLAEWNSQFLGDQAFQITDREKANVRWEARQFRSGNAWRRWDYPTPIGDSRLNEMEPVQSFYTTSNWRAFRTWEVSANSPWEHHRFWQLRAGVDKSRRDLPVEWDNLQRPGFSADYLDQQYERMDLAYEADDWTPTLTGKSLLRNNGPLLAYIAGKTSRITSKDHNFLPGEMIEKQLVIINNSRETVSCDCQWSSNLPGATAAAARVTVPTGQQKRITLQYSVPSELQAGTYELRATAQFSTGETQEDQFSVHILAPLPAPPAASKTRIALFDPKGETARLLSGAGIQCQLVDAAADLAPYELLIIGKAALTADGPAPDLSRVRDGLKVMVFEQTSEALARRLGFRVVEYGLRQVFARVPDHALLAGLNGDNLRDWRGEATILPPQLKYEPSGKFSGSPVVQWCGIDVTRIWRCGNRGNVASVLIEKPPRGDFRPIIDGGFSLQYSPLLEYREGRGMVLFCQLDVTGRTESDPAAVRLVANMLNYVSGWSAPADAFRTPLYAGSPEGKLHLQRAGISAGDYSGGPLTANQVLIVGAGGGQQLAAHQADIAGFLKSGGYLLALGLDQDEANRFLPTKVVTTAQEHLAAHFDPPEALSVFAGIGPADVHNRDPRNLPLLTSGVQALGNGVLAKSNTGNVFFWQLPPYALVESPEDAPGWTVTADDALDGKQSALLTLGTVPSAQFGQKVPGGAVGKKYTFAAYVKSVDRPARARLEIERAGSPWDRAVRGEDTEVGPKEWIELRATFTVDKPFPEGWQAYVNCDRPGTRLRVDLVRLYEGDYVPARPNASATDGSPANLLANASCETGTEPWFFLLKTEQQNLRRTFRRSAYVLTRLLANMGVRGDTPLLTRFSTPASGPVRNSLVANGDFQQDSDGNGLPDAWSFSSELKDASAQLETLGDGDARRCLRLTCPTSGEGRSRDIMLSQMDVPVEEGQWYRIDLRAKSKGMDGGAVTLALQNTVGWRSLIEYQRFTPTAEWKEFTFIARASATAPSKTRLQIWHGVPGTMWLADIRMAPCDPPSQGRWSSGLYLDQVQEWDDPYRFFRW